MRQDLVVGLVACILGAGCLANGPDAPPAPVPADCSVGFAPGTLLGDVGPTGIASEPAMAFGPNGEVAVGSIWIPTAFLPVHVASQLIGTATQRAADLALEPGGQNAVWFSENGADFRALHNVVGRLAQDGHQGNQDADLTFSPTGALHVALYGPNGMAVLTTRDQGNSWTESGLVSPQAVDRQWIEVGPNGELVVAWRGLEPMAGLDESPPDVGFARSLDDGETWEVAMSLLDQGYARGPLVRDGESLVHPVNEGDSSGLSLARGTNGGASWALEETGSEVRGEPGFVVPLALANGSLSLTWTDDSVPARVMQIMRNVTGTWSAPTQISPIDQNAAFPWPVQRPDGTVIVFYYATDGDGPATTGDREWSLAYSFRCAGGDAWGQGLVQPDPVHHGAMCFDTSQCRDVNYNREENDRSLGEIFEAGVSSTGEVWVAWTATTNAEVRSNQIWVTHEA